MDHLREMLPIVYTPTVALAIERYSHQYRRPRGVFLSIDHPELVEESFRNFHAGPEDIDLIVASDGARILGIGDGASVASTSPSASWQSIPRPPALSDGRSVERSRVQRA